MADTPMPSPGASLTDLVSTQKGGVQNLSQLVLAIGNALAKASASSSPLVTPVNNLGTSGTAIVAGSSIRHGLIFHNPGTASVYVYPSTLTSNAPTLTAVGGSFIILPAAQIEFPSIAYQNVNCGWSAFAGTGTNQALTVVEFY